jgi:hypothetical protein
MSPAAARRLHRHQRHVCRQCRSHPARFRYRGEVRADRDHTLCFRCYRAEVNRARARRLSEVTLPRVEGGPRNSTSASDRRNRRAIWTGSHATA